MKIVEAESVKTTNKGRKELNPVEKWLFDKENKKVRLSTLMNMENNKAAIVELSELGTDKKNSRNLDNILNRVFILGEIALIARRGAEDKIVIRKIEKFDIEQYNKGDKKPMSNAHIEIVKSKLTEVLA